MKVGTLRRVMSLALLLFCLPVTSHSLASGPPATSSAVVAVVDTGINPYHRVFRDRSTLAYRYPGTYLPGYPKGAIALRITLDSNDYFAAVRKDCDRVWSQVKPGQLYWFPGTKIVGAISFGSQPRIDCSAKEPGDARLLSAGHGAMTASRAASTTYGGCRECRIVSVQVPLAFTAGSSQATTDTVTGLRWSADNRGWIDVQSNSWTPGTPVWAPTSTGMYTSDPELVRAVEESSQRQLAFFASGNGVAGSSGYAGHPTFLAPHLGPSAIIVGGFDSGYVTAWPGSSPTLASDACMSWATEGPTTTSSTESTGMGTSASTPYVAGGAARIILEARRILRDTNTGYRGNVLAEGQPGVVKAGPLQDGSLTIDEVRQVLFHTATPRPLREHDDGADCGASVPFVTTPLQWKDVPPNTSAYYLIGYGAVDTPAKDLAFRVLRGAATTPSRPDDDQLHALDQQMRSRFYSVYSQ